MPSVNEIFRLVSLRGPTQFNAITVGAAAAVSSLARELIARKVDPYLPDVSIARILKREEHSPIRTRDLNGSNMVSAVSLGLGDLIKRARSSAVPFSEWQARLQKTIAVGRKKLSVQEIVESQQFARDMRSLWDAWIYVRLGNRINPRIGKRRS